MTFFEYRGLLGSTKADHDRLVHITLGTGESVRLTIPAVLGADVVIGNDVMSKRRISFRRLLGTSDTNRLPTGRTIHFYASAATKHSR